MLLLLVPTVKALASRPQITQALRLAESGLVTVTRQGNQKHYQANRHSPVFTELHGLAVKRLAGSRYRSRAA